MRGEVCDYSGVKLFKRKFKTAVKGKLGKATLRPVLLPLSVQHEVFYLM